MRHHPVNWSEGMFLLPHHFQAADQYWNEFIQGSEHCDHEYNYGLRSLDLSLDALGNSHFQVNSYQARMRDGTYLSLEATHEPDRVEMRGDLDELGAAVQKLNADLKEHLAAQSAVRVYLAVPKFRPESGNVSRDSNDAQSRYRETVRQRLDESLGENDQEVGHKVLQVRLMLSTDDLSGYDVLPIGQVSRVGERKAGPQLDVQYIPPLLSIDAWPPLNRDIVRAIYDKIGKKIEVLSEQVVTRGINLASQEPGDLDRLFMLMQLSQAYTSLGVIGFAGGIHPLTAYWELCRIVGQLSLFAKHRRPPEVPRYDHDDLGRIFYWVRDKIEELLAAIVDPEYEQRYFIGAGMGMQVALEQRWLTADWQWYVGVAHERITDLECRELLEKEGNLDWKLGSRQHVETLFGKGFAGLQMKALGRTPRFLPLNKNWNYYQISREGLAWKDVQVTQTLAMRLRDSLIVRPEELQGKRKLVVKYRGREVELEFALFAVRMPS